MPVETELYDLLGVPANADEGNAYQSEIQTEKTDISICRRYQEGISEKGVLFCVGMYELTSDFCPGEGTPPGMSQ